MPNYGIGSRKLFDAGRRVLRQRSPNGFKTQDDYIDRWRLFCAYAQAHGIHTMEAVSRAFVIGYGQHLQRQLTAGVYRSASSPKNYLSAVNCVMKLATDGDWQTVKPGLDCGIARRQFIPRLTKALSETRHRHLQQAIGDRLAHLLALQRTFGLRFKESCLLNPKAALKQAEKSGFIVITAGTKGGRRRRVPCDDHGIGVLKAALTLQCGNSMIPDEQLSYFKFRKECYEQARSHGFAFHSERHAYAQMRYRELVKAPCPLEAGWPHKGRLAQLADYLGITERQAKAIDATARLTIAQELGHARVAISHAYLG